MWVMMQKRDKFEVQTDKSQTTKLLSKCYQLTPA